MTTHQCLKTTLISKKDMSLTSVMSCCVHVRFQIYEEVEIGTEVGEVVATDNDSGDLGRVVYSISDNDKLVPSVAMDVVL